MCTHHRQFWALLPHDLLKKSSSEKQRTSNEETVFTRSFVDKKSFFCVETIFCKRRIVNWCLNVARGRIFACMCWLLILPPWLSSMKIPLSLPHFAPPTLSYFSFLNFIASLHNSHNLMKCSSLGAMFGKKKSPWRRRRWWKIQHNNKTLFHIAYLFHWQIDTFFDFFRVLLGSCKLQTATNVWMHRHRSVLLHESYFLVINLQKSIIYSSMYPDESKQTFI